MEVPHVGDVGEGTGMAKINKEVVVTDVFMK